jgi:hypothetical protein
VKELTDREEGLGEGPLDFEQETYTNTQTNIKIFFTGGS